MKNSILECVCFLANKARDGGLGFHRPKPKSSSPSLVPRLCHHLPTSGNSALQSKLPWQNVRCNKYKKGKEPCVTRTVSILATKAQRA
jgi:hypothetical protein